jgi:hypothetical protein
VAEWRCERKVGADELHQPDGRRRFVRRDHAGIAQKQIAYLLEQMRSSYGVGTEERGEELYEAVAIVIGYVLRTSARR